MSPWLSLVLVFAIAGCATWRAPAEREGPADSALRERAVTASSEGVRVSAAVLSDADTRRMFGTDLTEAQVQPVWIEIQNTTSQPKWLLRSGTDPEYLSPHEVAWTAHTPLAGRANAAMDRHFDKLGFKNPIAPGATSAGIVFTNPERLTKLLNVDVLGQKTLVPFTLFVPVPQESAAAGATAPERWFRYPPSQVTDHRDLDALRAALERLPCCAGTRGAARTAPLNVVLIGELADIGSAMVRRNYRRDARPADMANEVFGRGPDVVLRKQAQARGPSTWIRAWLTPVSFEGRSVYLAQVARPVGGRLAAIDGDEILPHDDTDEARNLLVQDMMYSGGLDKLGVIRGAGAREQTDGLRAVMFFETRPLSLADVEILDWVPYLAR